MSQAAPGPPRRQKTSAVWTMHRTRPGERDLVAGDPGRVPATVPVLVEVEDRLRGDLPEADRTDDRCAPLAAQLDQRPRALASRI